MSMNRSQFFFILTEIGEAISAEVRQIFDARATSRSSRRNSRAMNAAANNRTFLKEEYLVFKVCTKTCSSAMEKEIARDEDRPPNLKIEIEINVNLARLLTELKLVGFASVPLREG